MSGETPSWRLAMHLSGTVTEYLEDRDRDVSVYRRGEEAPEAWERVYPDDKDIEPLSLDVPEEALLYRLRGTDTVVMIESDVTVTRAPTLAETLPLRRIAAREARRREERAQANGLSIWKDGEPAWIARALSESEERTDGE